MKTYQLKVYAFNGTAVIFTASPTLINGEIYLVFPNSTMRRIDKTAVVVDFESGEIVYNPRDLTPFEEIEGLDIETFHSDKVRAFLKKHPEWPNVLELDWDKTKWRVEDGD